MDLSPTPHPRKNIPIRDASLRTGYSKGYLSSLCRSGKVRGDSVNGEWFVDLASLEVFIAAQAERKAERARKLAEARAREFQAHQTQTTAEPARKVVAIEEVIEIDSSLVPRSVVSELVAVSTAFAVVVLGALGAHAEALPRAANAVVAIATQASEGFVDAFGDIPARIASDLEQVSHAIEDAHAVVGARIASGTESVSPRALAKPDLSFARMAIVEDRSASAFVALQTSSRTQPADAPREFSGVARGAIDLAVSPERAAESLGALYMAFGTASYSAIEGAFGAYEAVIARAGTGLFSVGIATRDAIASAPEAVDSANRAFVGAVAYVAHAAVRADVSLAYALAQAGPESARATVALVGAAGGALVDATAEFPRLASSVFLKTAAFPATAAPALASVVFDAEYAAANNFVRATNAVSRSYLALVEGAGRTAYAGSSAAERIARSTTVFAQKAPATALDAYLAVLGHSAVAIAHPVGAVVALPPVAAAIDATVHGLSVGERAALATYDALHSAVSATTKGIAYLFGSTTRSKSGPSTLETGTVAASAPAPTAPAIQPASRPVSVTSYPTYTTVVRGVTQSDVDASIAALRANIFATMGAMVGPVAAQTVTNITTIQQIARIQDLADLIVRNGDFRGGTFDNGKITNATSIGGASASFGSLAVTGDSSLGGTISASGNITAPYFVASSTTATSTFSGSIAIDTNGFVYATSTRNVGIGVLSPAALLAIANSTTTQPIFTATTAGGTEAFRITDGGFVGIGTSTPAYTLAVEGTSSLGNAATAGYFTATTTATSTFAGRLAVGTSTPWGNGLLTIGTTSPLLYVDSTTGYIAIGNAAPVYTLDVSGNARFASFVDASHFVATSTTATSTFAGGLAVGENQFLVDHTTGYVGVGTTSPVQMLSVAGNGYFTGALGVGVATTTPGVLQTSGDAYVGGNLTVLGNSTVFGASVSDTLSINSSITSHIVPNQNATYDLGSPSYYWRNVYVGTLTANNISAASTTIGGTQSETFTLNSDNATSDTEDMTLVFYRGNVVPNALLSWNSTLDRFEMNQPFFVQNASASTTIITLDAKGTAGQTADVFRVSSSSGAIFANVTAAGRVGVGTSSPAVTFDIYATDAMRIPVGTTGERPSVGDVGFMRFNTTTHQFEGYGDNAVWQGLGGVIDADQDTKITADTNNGDEDTLRFFTFGSERMTITPTGTIGIASTTPWGALSINPDGVAGPTFVIGSSTATNFVVENGGNVGIGKSNPTQALDVTGNISASGTVSAAVGSFSTQVAFSTGHLITSGSTGYASFGTISRQTLGNAPRLGSAGTSVANSTIGNSAWINSASGPRIELGKSRGATIGTNTIVQDGDELGVLAGYGATGSGFVSAAQILFAVDGTPGATNDMPGRITFSTTPDGSGTLSERMRITQAGLIGVGSTTPWGLLSVNPDGISGPAFVIGSSTATNFIVTNAGKVGVGTSSPAQKLSVGGSIDIGDGYSYKMNGVDVVSGSTSLNNYFFGAAGNSTMTSGFNVAAGYQSFMSNTTGNNNAAYGLRALKANTIGNQNVAIGAIAMLFNTTGSYNTAVGYSALAVNTTGAQNAAFGESSLATNSTGTGNTAIGDAALYANTTGSYNTAVGMTALQDLDITANNGTGQNTAIGYNTGRGIVTGTNNTIIGANVTGLSATLSNNIIIADGAGNRRINVDSSGNVGIGTTSPTRKLSVVGVIGAYHTTGATDSHLAVYNNGVMSALSSTYDTSGSYTPLGFLTSSQVRMYIDTAGKIGVGTSSPAVAFDIYATDAMRLPVGTTAERPSTGDVGYVRYNTTTHQFEGYGDNAVWQGLGGVINAAQTTYITADDSNELHLVTNSVERQTITASGLVGIASTTPWGQLSINPNGVAGPSFVVGSSTATHFIVATSGDVGIGTASPNQNAGFTTLTINNATSGSGVQFQKAGVNKGTIFTLNDDLYTDVNTTTGKYYIRNAGQGLTFVTVDSTGNVGVGSTTPAYPLSVAGTIYTTTGIRFPDGSVQTAAAASGNAGTAGQVTYYATDGSTVSGTSTLFVASNQRVGIGTTTPDALLHVSGTNAASVESIIQDNQTASASGPSLSLVKTRNYISAQNNDFAGDLNFQFYNTAAARTTAARIQAFTSEVTAAGEKGLLTFATMNSGTLTEAMRITDTGNVGVGTTSPGYALGVSGTLGVTGLATFDKSGLFMQRIGATTGIVYSDVQNTGGRYQFGIDSSAGGTLVTGGLAYATALTTTGATALQFGTNGAIRTTIDSSGYVGIGTTSPDSILNISPGTTHQGSVILRITSSYADGYDAMLSLKNTHTGGREYALISTNDSRGTIGGGKFAIVDRTAGNNEARLIIDNAGNVGIGMTAPGARLSVLAPDAAEGSGNEGLRIQPVASLVNGSTLLTFGTADTAGYAWIRAIENGVSEGNLVLQGAGGNVGIGTTTPGDLLTIANSSGTARLRLDSSSISNNSSIDFRSGGVDRWELGTGIANTSKFELYDRASSATRFVVDTSGNVGIGTTAPGAKLEVNGSIKITSGSGGSLIFADGTTLSSNSVTGSAGLTSWGDLNFQTGGVIAFQTGNGTATSTRLAVSNAGYVGIGTASPSNYLHINASPSDILVRLENDSTTYNESSIRMRAKDASSNNLHIDTGIKATGAETGYFFVRAPYTTTRFVVTTDGYVGIGTTSPTYTLHIQRTAGAATLGLERDTNNQSNAVSYITGLTSDWLVGERGTADSDYHIYSYGTGGDALTVLRASGNVGIGTTSPSYRLQVYEDAADWTAQVKNVNANGYGLHIDINNALATRKAFEVRTSSTERFTVTNAGTTGIASTTPWGLLSVNPNGITGPSFVIGSSTATNFIVTNAGNVGIGIGNPSYPLQVLGTGTGTTYTSNISARLASGATGRDTSLQFSDTQTNAAWIGMLSGDLYFIPNGMGSTPAMSIASTTGYVGIGTTTPTGLLTLYGSSVNLDIAGTANSNIRMAALSGAQGRVLTRSSNDVYVGDIDANSGSLYFRTNGSTIAKFDTSGNFGVGSTTPWGLVSINPNGITGPAFVVGSSTATNFIVTNGGNVGIGISSSLGGRLDVQGAQNAWAQVVRGDTTSGQSYGLRIQAGTTSGDYAFLVRDATNASEYFNVLGNGNVGIGVATALSRLHVNGADSPDAGSSPAGALTIGATSGTTGVLTAGVDSSGTFYSWIQSRNNASTAKYALALNPSGGNVSVGTTTMSGSLTVQSHSNGWAGGLTLYPLNGIDMWRLHPDNNGDLMFTENDTNVRLIIQDSTGNVGVGDSNPASALTVNGDIRISSGSGGRLYFADGTSMTTASAAGSGTTSWNDLNFQTGGVFNFQTGNGSATSTKVSIGNAGHVSIGTTNFNDLGNGGTQTTLEVFKASGAGYLSLASDLTADGSLLGVLNFGTSGASSGKSAGSIQMTLSGSGATNASGDMHFYTRNGATYGERMTITSAGYIGVGTSSPSSFNGFAPVFAVAGNAPMLSLDASTNGGRTWYVGSASDGKLYVGDAQAGAYRMAIDTSGNVGIGTTAPGAALDVRGDMRLDSSGTTDRTIYFRNQNTVATIQSDQALALGAGNGANSPTEYMRIAEGGNIGVGSTTPYGLLSVNPNGITGPSFVIGSSTRTDFIVTNGGNVGIGTTTPADKLVVNGGALFGNIAGLSYGIQTVGIQASGNIPALFIGGGGTTGESKGIRTMAGTNSNDYALDIDDYNGNQMFLVRGDGQVGIGAISNPDIVASGASRVLGILGAASANSIAEIQLAGDQTTGTNTTGRIIFAQNSGGAYTASIEGFRDSADNSQGIRFTSYSAGSLAERMRLTSGGNVGIGTTSPSSLLHIYNPSATTILTVENGGANTASLVDLKNVTRTWRIVADASPDEFAIRDGNTDIIHIVGGLTSEAIRIGSGGDVGIGTTAPGYKLDVNGSLNATSVYVNGVALNPGTGSNWTVSGSDIYRSSGNVGIGTASPTSPLTVYYGAGNADTILIDGAAAYNNGIGFYSAGSQKWAIYRPGNTNDLRYWNTTFGADTLTLTGGGSVGIGTTNPNALLTLNETSSTTARIQFTNSTTGTSNGDGTHIYQSGNEFYFINKEASNINIGASNAVGMTLNSSNNLGIGTTTPGEVLTIAGVSPYIALDATGSSGGQIYFTHGSAAYGYIGPAQATNNVVTGSAAGDMVIRAQSKAIRFTTDGGSTSAMLIDSSGNVGIGTTSPNATLNVYGSNSVAGLFESTHASYTAVTINAQGASAVPGIRFQRQSANYGSILLNPSDNSLNFSSDYQLSNSHLTILSGGSVGVGSTTPWGLLSVNPSGISGPAFVVGSSTATSFVVTNAGKVGIGTTSPATALGIQGGIGVRDSQLYLAADGYIGIGTTSPRTFLHLSGANVSNRGQLTIEGSDYSQITFYKDTANKTFAMYQTQSSGDMAFANNVSGANTLMLLTGSGSFDVQGGNGNVMIVNGAAPASSLTVNSNGYVGMGTASAYKALEVHAGTDQNILVRPASEAVTSATGIAIQGYNDAHNATVPLSLAGSTVTLSASGAADVVVSSAGNVAIAGTGTTTIAGFLDVNGTDATNATSTFASNLWVKGALKVGTNSIYFSDSGISSTDGNLSLSSSATSTFANGVAVGTTQFVVQAATGNVGVGTATPGEKLVVAGNVRALASGASEGFLAYDATTAGTHIFSLTRQTNDLAVSAYGGIGFSTNKAGGPSSSYAAFIDTSGNVGIGTTTPSNTLDITGGARIYTSSSGTAKSLTLQNTVTTGYTQLQFTGTGRNYTMGVGNASETTYGVANKFFIFDLTGVTPRFTIDSSGNVGIGTTTPGAALDVYGNAARVGSASTNATELDIENYSTGGKKYALAAWGTHGSDSLQGGFSIYDNTAFAHRLFISSSGNVGIGITSPSSKLEVSSNYTTAYAADLSTNAAVYAAGEQIHAWNESDSGTVSGLSLTTRTTGQSRWDILNVWTNTYTGDLVFRGRNGGTSTFEAMRITSSGYVGIGRNDPGVRLDVYDSASVSGQVLFRAGAQSTAWPTAIIKALGNGSGNVAASANAILSLGDYTGGSSASLVTTGRIGIGTTSPAQLLHLYGVNSAIALDSPTGSGNGPTGIEFRTANSTKATFGLYSGLHNSTAVDVELNLGASNNFLISGGNVGIGTITPQADLSVATDVNNSSLGTVGLNISATSTAYSGDVLPLTFTALGGTARARAGLGMVVGTDWGKGSLAFYTRDGSDASLLTTSDERMRITSAGLVGIGTTAPGSKLSVNAGSTSGETTTGLIVYNPGSGAGTGAKISLGYADDDTHTAAVGGFYDGTGLALGFYTASAAPGTQTERMRISAAGNVLIGTASQPSGTGRQVIDFNAGSSIIGTVYSLSGASSGTAISFFNSPSVVGSITMNSTNTAYNTSSDRRVKENITATNLGLATLRQIQVHDFDFITDPAHATQQGFIAQELYSVYPYAVTTNGDNGTDPLGALTTPWQVDYGRVTPLIVQSLQDLANAYTIANPGNGATSTIASAYAGTTTPAITVDASGNVGIGTNTPSHTLTVAGDVAAISFVNTSTRTMKTDITYEDASTTVAMLGKLMEMKVATYRYTIEDQNDPLRLGLIAEDVQAVAPEVLSVDGKGVDIYKLATFTLGGVQALAAKVNAHETRLASLEDRVAALESGAVSSGSSTISFSTSTLANALSGLGVLIEKGIAQFNTLVFRQLVASKDADGTSSAGSVIILAGNTVAQVNNSLVKPTTKVFITFNGQVEGSWWVSDKTDGSFRVVLSAAQGTDVSFDYFLVQTEGQLATPNGDGTYQGVSVAQSSGPDTVAPVITLLGDNPLHLEVGATFSEPGVSVSDAVDGTDPITTFVNGIEQAADAGTIDTASPTTYIITYRAMDKAGNTTTAQRSVIVGNPDGVTQAAGDSGQVTGNTSTTTASSGDTPAPADPADTTAPVVTLSGAAALELAVGDAFADPGASATDETDGDLTASIVVSGTVDTATPGLYTVTYAATDAAGNTGSVSRAVSVIAP